MTFTAPVYLLLLLIIPVMIKIHRIRPHTGAFTLHCIALAFLITAMAQPIIIISQTSKSVVLCVDKSPSIPNTEKNSQNVLLRNTKYPVILFDNDARLVQRPIAVRDLTESRVQATTALPALEKAYSILARSGGGEVILITDGQLSDQDTVLEYIRFMRSQNCIVHIHPAGTSISHDIILGEPKIAYPYTVFIPIRQIGDTTDMSVSLQTNGSILDEQHIPATQQTVVTLQGRAPEKPVEIWEVVIRSSLKEYTELNNTVYLPVSKQDKKRILRISDSSAGGLLIGTLADTFDIIDAHTETTQNRFIPIAQTFDLILLDDIPSYKLSKSHLLRITHAVRDTGTGLIMCGLYGSFATGGYSGTEIADVLPVTMAPRPPNSREDFYILLDTSGSMDTRSSHELSQLDAAVGATVALANALEENDRISVIAFDIEPRTIIPISSPAHINDLSEQLAVLTPKGGTDIASVIETAFKAVMANAGHKGHIILVSDGQTNNQDRCIELVRLISEHNKTMTVIGIGANVDTVFLEHLAQAGSGRAYHINDVSVIANIFLREKNIATGDYISHEPTPMQIASDKTLYDKFESDPLPVVDSHTRLSAKAFADVQFTTPNNSPLIASWQTGLGTAAVWASQIEPEWMQNWVETSMYSKIFKPLFISTARKQDSGDEFHRVSLDVISGRIFISGTGDPIAVDSVSPEGYTQTHTPVRIGNKFYSVINPQKAGTYAIAVRYDASTVENHILTISYPPEYANLSPDWNFISTALDISQGKIHTTSDALREYTPSTVIKKKKSIGGWLIFTAILLYIVELAIRKRVRFHQLYERIHYQGFRSLFK